MDDVQLVRVLQAGADLLQHGHAGGDVERPVADFAVGQQLAA